MRRDAEKELLLWKNQRERYPLLIRGARQVGKSYLVESFAKENFKNSVTVNFELQPHLKSCFSTLEPSEIVGKLELLLGVQINKESTILFFDEIQEYPEAIMSLRYFKEKMPTLPVIGAGSLLEFALQSSNFRMPVGRVQFLYLEPVSFAEFLDASGNKQLREYLSKIQLTDNIEEAVHIKLIDLLRLYLILGGMPAVLKEYFSNINLLECQNIQNSLLQTYRGDFGKYAKTSQHKYLLKIFDSAPRMIGQRIKYAGIDPEVKSRELKNALELLSLAGIIKQIYLTHASGLPLGAQINEQKFKLNFLDVGLMQNACGLQGQLGIEKNLMQINSGSIVEQFVGQELRAYADKHQPSRLFFWSREIKSSSAEIDYVINIASDIFPLEVKAGKTGTLRSLQLFMKEKNSKFGIRISQGKMSYYDNILSIPLYMVEQLPRLVQTLGVNTKEELKLLEEQLRQKPL